jgi:hypothetical protein
MTPFNKEELFFLNIRPENLSEFIKPDLKKSPGEFFFPRLIKNIIKWILQNWKLITLNVIL